MPEKTHIEHETEREKASRTVKPHENPGPRGNPEIEHAALEAGIQKLERI